MRMIALLVVTLTLSSARVSGQSASRKCTLDAGDVAGRFLGEVFRDCEVDRPAKRRKDAQPSFEFPERVECVTATLMFVVDSTGVPEPSSVVVLKTDNPDFATALIATLDRTAGAYITVYRRASDGRWRITYWKAGPTLD